MSSAYERKIHFYLIFILFRDLKLCSVVKTCHFLGQSFKSNTVIEFSVPLIRFSEVTFCKKPYFPLFLNYDTSNQFYFLNVAAYLREISNNSFSNEIFFVQLFENEGKKNWSSQENLFYSIIFVYWFYFKIILLKYSYCSKTRNVLTK